MTPEELRRILAAGQSYTVEFKGESRALGGTGKPECVPYHFHEMQARLAARGALDPSTLPIPGASRSDLDPVEIERYRRFVRENPGRGDTSLLALSDLDLLKALGGAEGNAEVRELRLVALLLFGKEESLRRFVPTHEVAFHVLRGPRVEVNEFSRRPLLRAMDDLLERFRARYREDELFLGARRIGLPEIAPEAFREALANALTHRDYSRLGAVHVQWHEDRVDVLSPGGFPEGVRLDNLLVVGPKPRNPALADAFKRAGLVERTARGVDLMFEVQIRAGRPLPDYSRSDDVGIVVSLPRGSARRDFVLRILEEESRAAPFTFEELLALDTLSRSGRATVQRITSTLQTSEERTEEVIADLARRGCVAASGTGKRRSYSFVGLPAPRGVLRATSTATVMERRILEAARAGSALTRRQVAGDLGISPDQAKRLLERLVRSGSLVRTGRGRAVSYRARPKHSGAPDSRGRPRKARRIAR